VKKSVLITLVALLVTFVIFAVLISQPEPQTAQQASPILTPELESELIQVAKKVDTKASVEESATIEEGFDLYENEVFTGQVQLIADGYAETARFPVGSQPIRNLADARQPEPFEETSVETPFETESGETLSVSAAVDKFQYFTNDIINVQLSINGLSDGAFVQADATISGPQGDTSLKTSLRPTDASQALLIGSFDTSVASPNTFSNEMVVKVALDVGGEPFFTTVSFNYNNASAQLSGLGFVQPNGPNLDIPLEYTVFIGGYYFVSAILRDQESNTPLITLQTEGRMAQGNGRLTAQAHIQALKEAGSEGPYLLTNIKAYRGAERGEQFDIPASTLQPQYAISAYPLSVYQDEEYSDPLAEERVEFLRKLGQLDTNSNPSTNEEGIN